jgi:hypothetical protein
MTEPEEIYEIRCGTPERSIDHGKVQTLWYADGTVRLRHVCFRPRDGRTLIVAPALVLDEPSGHTVVSTDPVTVTPSCGCFDCGLHGFLTEGVWRDC